MAFVIFVILLAANKMCVLILQLIFELLNFQGGISQEIGGMGYRNDGVVAM